LGFCLMIILQSCHKDSLGPFIPYVTPTDQQDTIWSPVDTAPQITDSIIPRALVDSFTYSGANSGIAFGDSASISFPIGGLNILNSNGDTTPLITPAPKIRAEVLVLRTKGDLIRHGMSSVDNNNTLLEFGAYIHLALFYKGNPVYWKNPNHPFKITVKDPRATLTFEMQYYVYRQHPDSISALDSSWFKIPNVNGVIETSLGYQLNATTLGWSGCSLPLDVDNHPSTILNVALPSNYTNKNTVVYAVFNNSKTVVKLTPNHSKRNFSTGKIIPTGLSLTLVSISKLTDGYYLGNLSTTIPKSSKIIVLPTPTKQLNGLVDINNFLNSL